MFSNSILDVVIGLVFVFFVCSLAVSGINEFVRKLLNTRAKALWTAISRMLDPSEAAAESERITARLDEAPTRQQPNAGPDGTGARGVSLAELLYDHPSIGRLDPARLTRPTRITHIAPTEFARALVDILTPEDGDGNKRWEQLGDEIRALPRPLRAQLLVLHEEAGGDLREFRQAIEGWFTSSMDRVSEWYRRRTRVVMFGYGLLVAVAFNVSAVHVTSELYENDIVRESVVELAAAQTAAGEPAGVRRPDMRQGGDRQARRHRASGAVADVPRRRRGQRAVRFRGRACDGGDDHRLAHYRGGVVRGRSVLVLAAQAGVPVPVEHGRELTGAARRPEP